MKRIHRFCVFLVLVIGVTHFAVADDKVKVTTIFDKRTVDINDEIKLTIRISGAQTNVLRPRVPHLDSFESYYTGRSNQFTFIDGRSESTTSFSYVLIPKRAGKFTLPPIEVDIDNEIYRTDPIDLEVLGRGSQTSALPPGPSGRGAMPSSSQAPFPQPGMGSSVIQKPLVQTVTPETERDIFLNTFADKVEAYPNEQILLTYSVFTRVSARAERFEKDPNLNGFWVEEIPIERDYQPEKIIFGGAQYVKADVRRLAIFPTTTGTFEIDPGIFRATVKRESHPSSVFDDFFDESFFGGSFFSRREQKLLTAAPLKIVVRPLPEQGKPADFSGMIGQFRMTSGIDKRSVKQNEPIILTISIEGEGNIEMIERPKIPESKDIKVYDSDSSTELSKYRGGLRGRKTFEVTLIPTAAGEFEIPSLVFNFFNSRQGTYEILKTTPYQIKVRPGPPVPLPEVLAKAGADKSLKKKIELESRDIRFIKENFDLKSRRVELKDVIRLILIFNSFLTVLCLILFSRSKYEARLDQDLPMKRSRYAFRVAQKGLKSLKRLSSASKDGSRKKFFEEAPKVLNNYFADKFNLSPQGLTLYEIETRLEEKGLDRANLESLKAFYEMCDRIRFTSSDVPQIRSEELLKVMQSMIHFLEKQ